MELRRVGRHPHGFGKRFVALVKVLGFVLILSHAHEDGRAGVVPVLLGFGLLIRFILAAGGCGNYEAEHDE